MEKNRNIDEDMMSQVSGGDVGSFENAEEYRYTVFQTIRNNGYCPCCGAALFRVNKTGDYSLEEVFAERHLKVCDPYLKHYRELGGSEY